MPSPWRSRWCTPPSITCSTSSSAGRWRWPCSGCARGSTAGGAAPRRACTRRSAAAVRADVPRTGHRPARIRVRPGSEDRARRAPHSKEPTVTEQQRADGPSGGDVPDPDIPANARSVRDEDAFDVDAVAAWLSRTSGIDGIPEVRQFSGGASNLTYLLRYPDRDVVLRRPPAGAKPASGHDMHREYRIQELLAPAYPHVPAMVGLCTDPSVLGTDFYVMERVHGTILRSDEDADLDAR